jgi:hypothetical protein
VAAVLSYAHENNVDLFLEPVLELCAALLDQDAVAMDNHEPGDSLSRPACLPGYNVRCTTQVSPPWGLERVALCMLCQSQPCPSFF